MNLLRSVTTISIKSILSIFSAFCLFSTLVCDAQNITNKGKEFWVGYGHHQFMEPGVPSGIQNSQEMILYFSAEQAATVTVTVKGRTATQITNYSVPANSVIASNLIPKSGPLDARLYNLPPSFGGNGGEGLFNVSIHIESNVPLVAYAHIFGSVSSGATMLLPVEAWGHTYTSINSQQIDAGGPGFSWVYVIAKENNTLIRITPSVPSRLNKPAGVPFDVTLQKGEIYQIIGQSDANGNGNQFTGTTVKSIANASGDCFPVAVFSGSSRTRGEAVPCGSGSGRDNDMQQAFPQQAWGRRYLTAPFSTASGSSGNVSLNASTFMTSVYKIAVKDPTTVVKRNGVPLSPLITPGNYYQFSSNTADIIEADKPVMVGQFMSGSSTCNPGSWGDPEMVFLSPIEQAIKRVGFYRNNRQSIYANYVTVIIPTAGVSSLRIDGSNVFNHTYPHPNMPGYSVVVKGWQATPTQCQMYSDSAFTAITYGLGSAESYAYNAGTFLNNLAVKGEIYNIPDSTSGNSTHQFTCKGTPAKLSALVAYKPTKMVWRLSQVSTISPNTDVTDNNPSPSDSVIISSAKYYRFTLPGTYTFSDTGSFDIPIHNTHPSIENCTQTEEVKITVVVKPSPISNLSFTHTGCQLDTVYFGSSTAGGNGLVVNRWNWTFGDATGATIQNPSKLYAAPGNYTVTLRVTTTEGCIGDSSRTITVGNKPVASIVVTPPAVCAGTAVSFSDTTGNASTGTWYWDFGNGTTASLTGNTPQTVTYAAPGNYIVKHLVKASATCISDTVTKVVTVYQNPAVGFTNTQGCLPPNGPVQFTDTTNTYGQAITSWAWNFGDPGSGATNTSTLQNPTHPYSAGTYTITLTVTTQNGCVSQKSVQQTFTISPVVAASPDTAICIGSSAILTTSGAATYTWSPATGLSATTGSTVTANPTITTTYVVTGTTNSCSSTDSVTVTVNPKPAKPVATTPVTYCQNTTATPLSATALPGHTLTWYNNPTLTGGTTTAPTPLTNTAGTFYYYVTQTGAASCTSDTARIEVVIIPVITANTISADQTLCSGVAATTLTGTGNLTGGTGTYTYQWQLSINGGTTWTNIAGATSATYDPGIVSTGITKFRRMVGSGLCSGTSNEVTITVQTNLSNYDISANQSICESSTPALLNGQTPTGGTGAYTYQWETSPNGTAWALIAGATSEDYQPAALTSTSYFRRITSGGDCPAISSVVIITVNPLPNSAITGPAGICSYNAGIVSVTATGGTAPYSIQVVITAPGGGTSTLVQTLSTNGPAAITVLPVNSAPGNYTVQLGRVTDSKGCTRTTGLGSVIIMVTAKPVITINTPPPVCQGTSTSLTASGATTYTWSPSTGLDAATGSTVTATPIVTTTYGVMGTTNGCSDTAMVTVTVIARPAKPVVTPSVAYCQRVTAAPLSAAASAGNTLTWYDNATLSGGSSMAPTPSTITVGTVYYYVTQMASNNCISDTAGIAVTINPVPVAAFNLPAGVCMPNGTATFINTSTIPDGTNLGYVWNFGDGTATSSATSPGHIYAASGSYNVNLRVTSVYGCRKDTAITFNKFYEKPIAAFSVNADALCQGRDAVFTDLSNPSGSTITKWQWNFGDMKMAAGKNPVHRYTSPGNYTVSLVITTAIGCVSDTVYKNVRVYLQPKIDAGTAIVVRVGTTVQLNATAADTSGVRLLWSPATGLSSATVLRPTLTVQQAQVYTVTAIGQNNCTATDTVSVRILKAIEVPNVFSPNGDGVNDLWLIPGLAEYPGAKVQIYNRWGQLVFTSYGYAKPWDGTYLGKPLPLATYYYIITLNNGFTPVTGSVTIIK